jgi:hypothetical protein
MPEAGQPEVKVSRIGMLANELLDQSESIIKGRNIAVLETCLEINLREAQRGHGQVSLASGVIAVAGRQAFVVGDRSKKATRTRPRNS